MEELLPNTNLSHYIVSKIGAGGMGEVYLALDTKLDRKVALKILPAEVSSNQDRMRRFVQEAKAASALNHPNIITIYEIAESGNMHFIATEYNYALAGEPGKAHKALDELRKMSKQRYVSPYLIAVVYAGLGDKEQAFAWLEQAYQDRSFFSDLAESRTTFRQPALRPALC